MNDNLTFENLPTAVNLLHSEIKELKQLFQTNVIAKVSNESDLPLSIKEVAKLTNLREQTLYGYCQRNEIPYHKKGKRLYFFKSEIIEWIKQGRVKTFKELEQEANLYLINKK